MNWRRDLGIAAGLYCPTAVHDLYHAVDGLSNWRAAELLPWLKPFFGDHNPASFGFYAHVFVVASTTVAYAWVMWRLAVYGRVVEYWTGKLRAIRRRRAARREAQLEWD